jgi:hypothetical protein
MRRFTIVIAVAAAACLFALPSLAAKPNKHNATSCTDTLAPGTYGRVVVPAGAVCLIGEGPLTIRGGLYVEAAATFVFGSEEDPDVNATISGGVHGSNAGSVQIHFSRINGGVDLQGGAGPFGGPFDFGGGFNPTWTTLEDNTINGAVRFEGYDGFWSGFIRNNVHGSVSYNDNTVLDTDGNEVVTNTIHGSLKCSGNDPAPQIGDSEGSPNQVTGAKKGQCADL